ncbi:DEAD/DEAH box helicase [Sphingobacterium siyangense]|uniref:DEAD/DEAH box helicase n=1 Tax=Sphingobacterium siyangense TaxID=459529 RepID=UPI003DA411FD
MQVNPEEKYYQKDPFSFGLINHLKTNEKILDLANSFLYYDFPIYKDFDGDFLASKILLVSKNHGVILVSNSNKLELDYEELEQLHSIIFSRLLRNRNLRKTTTSLRFELNSIFFTKSPEELENVLTVTNYNEFDKILNDLKLFKSIPEDIFNELIATIEGAKALISPKSRDYLNPDQIKGVCAKEIEKEINSFDEYQKRAFTSDVIGPERIRGLAGSGKTVVLALKAAITHLRYPDAKIVYTFYTKSLYQHIKRLITRFYRQYDDKDPNWENIKIMHAWGSRSQRGIYYDACDILEEPFYTFSEAKYKDSRNPFDYVCKTLIKSKKLKPIYDFLFIDEGQDFTNNFITLCLKLCKDGKIIWAYDELQTIFQQETPPLETVLKGTGYEELTEDVFLYKCYRNPLEVLVVAHALGFGIYGKIKQMFDSKSYWEGLGYKIIEGNFEEGQEMVIERPRENSLQTVSKKFKKEDIIQYAKCNSFNEEIDFVVECISRDIELGLLPDDILVIAIDDRFAKNYLNSIQLRLAENGIKSNNIHSDQFGVKDFILEGHVTLSTIHKAKGNEAYSTYILGIDALSALSPTIRERNLIFTALTRTKAWVTITGIGETATPWFNEIDLALKNSPNLRFVFPSTEELKVMKRDISEESDIKQSQRLMLEKLLSSMSPEEIKLFLEQRAIKKRK